MTFTWKTDRTLADGRQYCEVGALILWASETGEWSVNKNTAGMARVIVSHRQQAPGEDRHEATQRAQAAALVQLQLMGIKTN